MKYECKFLDRNNVTKTIESDTPMGLLRKFAAHRPNHKVISIHNFVYETDDDGNSACGSVILGCDDAEFVPEA